MKKILILSLSLLILLSACAQFPPYVPPVQPQPIPPTPPLYNPADDVGVILGAQEGDIVSTYYGDLEFAKMRFGSGNYFIDGLDLVFDGEKTTLDPKLKVSFFNHPVTGNKLFLGDVRLSGAPTCPINPPPGCVNKPDIADFFVVPNSRSHSALPFTNINEGSIITTPYGSLEVVVISEANEEVLLKLDGHLIPKLKRGDMFRDVDKKVDLYVTKLYPAPVNPQHQQNSEVSVLFVE